MKFMFLRWLWDRLSTSYWFFPSVMTLSAAGLAIGLGALDESIQDRDYSSSTWLWTGGPEGARMLLGSVAGAIITVASTVFSITIVALTLASNAFGPRLLRNFIRDRGNQFVLGTFTATFVYCLLVLRTVRGDSDAPFVPHVSITAALALTLVNVGVLIYFIHHVSTSIQADEVIAIAGHDLDQAIASLHDGDDEPNARAEALELRGAGVPLTAPRSGYLQAIEEDRLLAVLGERDGVARLAFRPGHFIVEGAEIARVWVAREDGGLDEEARGELADAFLIDDRRTPLQDLEFSLHQLVEIAARALSPGINDPFTAATCIDWLGSGLCKLAARPPPGAHLLDEGGALRVIRRPFTFVGAIDAAFDPIRQNATESPHVLIHLMDTLLTLAACVENPEDRAAVLGHADKVRRAGRAWPEARDQLDLVSRHQRLTATLAAAPASSALDTAREEREDGPPWTSPSPPTPRRRSPPPST